MIRRVPGAFAIAIVLLSGTLLSMSRAETFPHEEHAGLFPTCLGCHRGIEAGDSNEYYSVAPEDCARCHDGQREDRVDWESPTRTPSNLVFRHADHVAEVARASESALGCAACHGPMSPEQPRMAVSRAGPETCVACHTPETPVHLAADAPCASCHRSLTEASGLPVERLATFPRPAAHDSGDFVLGHGMGLQVETCAICHAVESCARCHLNADRVPKIAELESDARVAELVAGVAGEWPEPPSHRPAGWEFAHGDSVRTGSEGCATCHAERSCRTCHGSAAIAAIATLPDPGPEGPPGVAVSWRRPPGHLPGFAARHGTAAGADMPRCASCHLEEQCADCHGSRIRDAAGPAPETGRPADPETGLYLHAQESRGSLPYEPRPGYHPENFLMRHGAEAFAVQTSCSDCHSTEVFCRDCHDSGGLTVGAGGGAGGAFHDAQPNWFFEHGRAARQGMESCASCHQQTSCLRCHSAKAGLRINPHGPGFDADRLAARSTIPCGVCHTAAQIPGGPGGG